MIYLFPVLRANAIANKRELKFISKMPLAIINKDDLTVSDFKNPIYNGKLNNPDIAFYYKLDTTTIDEKEKEEMAYFIKTYGCEMWIVDNEAEKVDSVKLYQPKRQQQAQ